MLILIHLLLAIWKKSIFFIYFIISCLDKYLAIGSVSLGVFTYACLGLSILLLCLSLAALCSASQRLRISNSTAIHVNIVCCVLSATATFISGVDNVRSEVGLFTSFTKSFRIHIFLWPVNGITFVKCRFWTISNDSRIACFSN